MKTTAEARLTKWFSGLPGWPVPPDEAARKVLDIIAQPEELTMREMLLKGLTEDQVDFVAQVLIEPTAEMFDALSATDKLWRDLDSKTVFTTMAKAIGQKPKKDEAAEESVLQPR